MKTKLEIDLDLFGYLIEEIDRTDNITNMEIAGMFEHDPFNMQWRFRFENGYGASVIKHWGSFGFEEDKFELAVLWWNGLDHGLCYDTEITDDVIGHLTNQEVMDILRKIKALNKEEQKDEN